MQDKGMCVDSYKWGTPLSFNDWLHEEAGIPIYDLSMLSVRTTPRKETVDVFKNMC
jgi:hypothetical protein